MTVSNWDDIVDSRAVVARVEELQGDLEAAKDDPHPSDYADAQELEQLEALLEELRTVGGDSPEDGMTLVRETYWVDYVKEMYLDCMEPEQVKLMEDLPWKHIDWPQVAEDLRSDYTIVTWDGVDFYVR